MNVIICWLQWIICVAGIVFEAFFTGRFKIFSTLLYLMMGWMIVFAWNDLVSNINTVSFVFLVMGGILYSLGTIFYTWKYFFISNCILITY